MSADPRTALIAHEDLRSARSHVLQMRALVAQIVPALRGIPENIGDPLPIRPLMALSGITGRLGLELDWVDIFLHTEPTRRVPAARRSSADVVRELRTGLQFLAESMSQTHSPDVVARLDALGPLVAELILEWLDALRCVAIGTNARRQRR